MHWSQEILLINYFGRAVVGNLSIKVKLVKMIDTENNVPGHRQESHCMFSQLLGAFLS